MPSGGVSTIFPVQACALQLGKIGGQHPVSLCHGEGTREQSVLAHMEQGWGVNSNRRDRDMNRSVASSLSYNSNRSAGDDRWIRCCGANDTMVLALWAPLQRCTLNMHLIISFTHACGAIRRMQCHSRNARLQRYS